MSPSKHKTVRTVANFLSGAPRLRRTARRLYRGTGYLLNREPGFCSWVAPGARLSPAWGCTESPDQALFFGYFDKSPWAPDMKAMLLHRAGRGKEAEIIVSSPHDEDARVVGRTRSWNLQQGAMAQWLDPDHILFNDCEVDRLTARIVTVSSGEKRTIPWPVQTVHPGGHAALTLNYRRLAMTRAEYGYAVRAENFAPYQALDDDGIWHINLDSGDRTLLVALEDLAERDPRPDMMDGIHWVNHILYSPSGSDAVFMHRWRQGHETFSRLYVVSPSDGAMRLLLDTDMISHYCWRDDNTLLAYARSDERQDDYLLIDITTGSAEVINKDLGRFGDGHPSFSPDRKWIITDSYPDKKRQQRLLLHRVETGETREVARLLQPMRFDGPVRCDLHPRWSPDGKLVSIDAGFKGQRLSYVVDLTSFIDNA